VAFEVLNATETQPGSHSVGSTATFTVTASGVPAGQTPSIDFLVTCGPDGAAACPVPPNPLTPPTAGSTGVVCAGSGPWTCSLTNSSKTAGIDGVAVFDDSNNTGKYDTNEPLTMLPITFGEVVTPSPASALYPSLDSNNPGSGIATVTAHVTAPSGQVPHLRWTVTDGPDKDTTGTRHTSVPCAPQNGGTSDWVCTIKNDGPTSTPATSGPSGLDTVVVYDDLNCSSTTQDCSSDMAPAVVATDPQNPVKVDFEAPSSILLTPQLAPGQNQAAIATGGCQVYEIDVAPGVRFPVVITASQVLNAPSSGSASPVLSTCNVPGGSVIDSSSSSVTTSGGIPFISPGTPTNTLTINTHSGQDSAHPGRILIGISSSSTGKDGTISLHANTGLATASNNVATQTQTLKVENGGQSAAHTLTVTPTSQTDTVRDTATFSVLVQAADGTPLPGTTVDYVVAAADPDATSKAVACPTADQFGKTTCSLTNNGSFGTDHLTFFAPQTSGETAPASTDPQTTATATFQALPPPGSTLSLDCPDQLAADAFQLVPDCTVSTAQHQVIFAAHIADPNNAPVPNIPVAFSLVSAPAGATASQGTAMTNSKGNALYIVTVNNPNNGDRISVQATVGNPSNGGLGPALSSATFSSPKPANVSVTPATQQRRPGDLVTMNAKVTDQFGSGVAGQTIDFSVSGRNAASGAATTGSNGVATISYFDNGTSGSDNVTLTDVSADAPSGAGSGNPAHALVTYSGGGGCTSNCGPPRTEHPSLGISERTLSRRTARLTLTVVSRPRLGFATVIFYQITRSGSRHRIGSGLTRGNGIVKGTLQAARGLTLRFQAKVVGHSGIRSGFTNVARIHVR
jgi:Fe-S cluster assembly iron-binding protein IscA